MDFALNFRGNLVDQAKAGASAVDTLTAALKAEERALKSAEVASARLKAAGEISVKPFKAAVKAKANISALKAELGRLGQNVDQKPGFFATLEKSRGPIGGLVKDARALGEAFSGNKWAVAAVGIAAVATTVVALSAAMVTGAYDAGVWALKMADAGRSARILNEAADIAGGTHSQLSQVIKETAETTALGKDKIAEYARALRIMRFDSRQTQLAVQAMAVAETALGPAAASAIKGIAEQSRASRRFVLGARDLYGEYTALAGTGLGKKDVFAQLAKQLNISVSAAEDRFRRGGVSVRQGLEAIEAATRAKFGGTIEKQLLGLDVQFAKAKEDIGTLFGGVNIEPLLKGLKKITGIFSDTTAGGRQTRLTITAALDELAAKAAKVFPYVESFLYGFGTGALNVYNVSIKPMVDAFSADLETGGLEGSFSAGEKAASALAKTLAGVLETINKIIDAGRSAAHVVNMITSPIETAKADAAAKQQKAFDISFSGKAASAQEATDAGVQLVAGITKGVHLGTPEAAGAMTGLADSMLAAFKARNKIHSPSKLYEQQAGYIPEGAARGIEKRSPMVQAAVEDMAAPVPMGGTSMGAGSFSAELAIDLRWPSGEVQREIRTVFFRAANSGPRPAVR